MHKVLTHYKATGDKSRGGYVLQWVGENKPSYFTDPKGVHSWYKHKSDAVASAERLNKNL